MRKRLIFIVVIFFLLFLGMKEMENKKEASAQIFAMDTIMDLKLYGKNSEKVLKEAGKEIKRLENLFSPTLENSDVFHINETAGQSSVLVSSDTIDIIKTAKEIASDTNEAFDITIAPIVKKWGFTTKKHYVPSDEEILSLLNLVDSNQLEVQEQENKAFLKQKNMAVDFGGIAKGYTSDKLSEMIKENGIKSAILSLGGNISAIGTRQNGQKWRVAVQDPEDSSKFVGIVNVENQSVITSGGYQRYFEENGIIYHHIIDPKTGKPANNDLLSVTIISKNGTKADALSTALFVMGLEKAVQYWEQSKEFDVIFITKDKKIIVTDGILNEFELNKESQDYEMQELKDLK